LRPRPSLTRDSRPLSPLCAFPCPWPAQLGLWPSRKLVAEEAMTAGGEVTVHEAPERGLV